MNRYYVEPHIVYTSNYNAQRARGAKVSYRIFDGHAPKGPPFNDSVVWVKNEEIANRICAWLNGLGGVESGAESAATISGLIAERDKLKNEKGLERLRADMIHDELTVCRKIKGIEFEGFTAEEWHNRYANLVRSVKNFADTL